MIAVTIQYNSDGKTSQVFGPEIDPKKQLDYVKKLKVEGLPEKINKVEMWSRAKGFVIAAAVSKKTLEKMAKDGDKAKADYLKEKEALKKDQEKFEKQKEQQNKKNAISAVEHLEKLKKQNGQQKEIKVLNQKK